MHPLGLLARLLLVFLELGKELALIERPAEGEVLQYSNERRDEVVIAQPRSILVEHEEEHDGHDIGHHLHASHSLACTWRLPHRVACVEDVCHRHQHTEEAEVIAEEGRDKGDVEVPRDDGVIGREVISP